MSKLPVEDMPSRSPLPALVRRSAHLVALLSASTLFGCGGGGGTSPGAAVSVTAASPTTASTATVIVGSTSDTAPGATHYDQLTDVPWASLIAGTTVRVASGSYTGPVTITAQGTAAAPITIVAIDPANPPVLTNSIDFQHAAWVQLSNLVVQSPAYSGIVIRLGSHHLVVADSLVSQAPLGILISDGAGTAISLLRNRVVDSATDGIGVDGINADPSDPSLIQGNVVLRSGHHGMEIRGSNYTIERNDVSLSGQAVSGTSGIHLFSAAEGDGTCANNRVRYNLSYQNADTQASDGNGIQADRWCDGNTIAFNVAWGNDGAGVAVYDGNNNQVYANTLRGNGVDPGGTHGSLGEIVVNSSQVGGTRPAGNRVYDNVLIATRAQVPALYVDTNAVALGSNVSAPNLLFNMGGGTVLRWTDSRFLSTLSDINEATGSTNNLLTVPAFADVTQPQADGLRLTASPGPGSVALTGQVDRLGTTGVAGASFFGAYFFGS